MMKLTGWYSGSQKPVRRGWYEVRNRPGVTSRSRMRLTGRPFRYWTGHRWLIAAPSLSWSFTSIFGQHETHEWRGVAK